MEPGSDCRALYDYEARATDELNFSRHQIIRILGQDEEDEGWYRGEFDGRVGLFPGNYVQPVPRSAAPEPPAAAAASAASAASPT